jgi:integrase
LKAGPAWRENDLVFCNMFGNFLHPFCLYTMFDKVPVDAVLPHMHFHDLRHSAATILLAMGVNIKVVQEILGHSQVSMTPAGLSSGLSATDRESRRAIRSHAFKLRVLRE